MIADRVDRWLAVMGVASGGLVLFHAVQLGEPQSGPLAVFFGVLVPLVIALGLVALVVWSRENVPREFRPRLVGWFAAGTAAFGVATILLLSYLELEVGMVTDPRPLIANGATGGAAAGALVGVYDAQRRRRDRALVTLQEASRDLLRAEEADAVCERAVEAARTLLDANSAAVRLYRRRDGELVGTTAARTDGGSSPPEPLEELAVAAYRDGERRLGRPGPDEGGDGTDGGAALALPLGEHGALLCRSGDGFDELQVELAEMLARQTRLTLERTETVRQLREREEELARQNERLEQFASVVSHDLRTPLSVVQGYAAVLEEDPDPEHVEQIRAAVDRMDEMIDGLLKLARSGDAVDASEAVDLGELVGAAWGTVGTAEAELTTADGLGTVRADRARLAQLLENLFRNAVEHGGEDVAVTVGPLADDDGFYVADDGPGLPDEDPDTLFEYGFTTGDSGNGLGLSIVREVAQGHGWTVAASDAPDGGARFEVRGLEWVSEEPAGSDRDGEPTEPIRGNGPSNAAPDGGSANEDDSG